MYSNSSVNFTTFPTSLWHATPWYSHHPFSCHLFSRLDRSNLFGVSSCRNNFTALNKELLRKPYLLKKKLGFHFFNEVIHFKKKIHCVRYMYMDDSYSSIRTFSLLFQASNVWFACLLPTKHYRDILEKCLQLLKLILCLG